MCMCVFCECVVCACVSVHVCGRRGVHVWCVGGWVGGKGLTVCMWGWGGCVYMCGVLGGEVGGVVCVCVCMMCVGVWGGVGVCVCVCVCVCMCTQA